MTTNRQVSIKGSTPTADLDLFGTFKVRDDAVFDSSVTSRSLYSYYLSISDNTSINRLSVGGDARFYLPTYFDSLMTANEIRAQLLGAGIIISDSAQLESVISSIINATRINGINIYSTKITAERINTDTVITVVLSCGNAKFTGTVLASDISTGNLSVTGTSTLHKIIVSDGVSITSLAGSNVGLIQYDTTGKLTRLDFTSNPNDILTGTGDFRNINTLVPPPDTGWQWYDTTVLLSTAPVVAIQNNLVVGNRVSIGSLRMSNGSATDTMTTDRRFALEAAKILLKADTVQLQNYATAREMTFDTVTTNKYAKVGSDTSKYNPPVTGTLALEVAGSATVKGDVAVKGSIASNTIATNDLTISSTISSPKIITSRITSPDSLIYFGDSTITINYGQNFVYSNNYLKIFSPKKVLELQTIGSQNIFMSAANNSLVGIGTWQPQKKLHIFTQHNTDGGEGQASSHQGIRLENLVEYDNSVWDIEPIVDNGIKFTLGTPSKEIFTLTNYGYAGLNTLSPKYDFQIHSDSMVNWSSYISPFGGVDPPPPGLPVQVGLAMMQITNASTDKTSGDGLLLGTFNKETFLVNQENGPMKFGTNDLTRMTITEMGDIGIGTKTPQAKLDVNGNALFAGNVGIGTNNPQSLLHLKNGYGALTIETATPGTINSFSDITFKYVGSPGSGARTWVLRAMANHPTYGNDLELWSVTGASFHIVNANVGIGTTCPQYKLDVTGTIRSQEWIVENFTGCDFVFDENYKRMNYEEKEKWFKEKKHLPGIAPAKESDANGIKAGETLSGIIMNVEENSLDIIDLYKQIQELKKENEMLQNKIRELELRK